jgi:hypothetical protein
VSRTLNRFVGAGVIALVSFGVMAGSAGVANAAPAAGSYGTLTTIPATGSDVTVPKVHTSQGCTDTNADNYNVYISGPSFSQPHLIVTTIDTGISNSAPFDAQFNVSVLDAVKDDNGPNATITPGEYDVTLNCVNGFSPDDSLGTFTTAMYFTSPTAYNSGSTATSTSLAVTPGGPVNQGDSVTLKATVSPAAAGSVQFKDGAANLGSPVTVAGGIAQMSTTSLSAGSHSLSAVFTSSDASFGNSSSAGVSLTVNHVVTNTTTTLSANPASGANEGDAVALTATVSPATAGTVQFKDGSSSLGSPVTVSGGTAVKSTFPSAGAHTFTATFVPADAASFNGSTSAEVPMTVGAHQGVSTDEQISTTVDAGALTISVEGGNHNVTLPDPQLNSDATLLQTSGAINPILVSDTRAGNPGWSVSGQLTDFSNEDGNAAHRINAGAVGWTPSVGTTSPNTHPVAGPVVQADSGIGVDAAPASGKGLATSRSLAVAAAGSSTGTAQLKATVSLDAPTSTVAGKYTATLTLTAI